MTTSRSQVVNLLPFQCGYLDVILSNPSTRTSFWAEPVPVTSTIKKVVMSKKNPNSKIARRRFLKTAVSTAGAAVFAPTIIPSSALGRDGAIAPSERVVVGGIGIGNRGTYDLGCFLEQKDVQFVAVCDVKQKRRVAVKKMVDIQIRQSEL